MGEFLVERRRFGNLVELAVDFDALVALLHELGELLAVLALAAADHRRQQIKPRAFRQRHDAVDHLRDGLAFDRQPGGRRIGHTDARPKQTHVVVNFGDGADGRPRIARGGLLFNRDRGRQAVDLIDVRLLHHFEKLPRVSGQALDVAPLPFGVDRVEGERGFAGPGQSRKHHETVARNVEIDVFEIVLARTADGDHAAIVRAALIRSAASGLFSIFFEQVVQSMYAPGSLSPPKSFSKSSPRSLDSLRTGGAIAVAFCAQLAYAERAEWNPPAASGSIEPASNIVRTAGFCQQARRAIPAKLVRSRE